MAPDGGVCKQVVESHPKHVKYDVGMGKMEKNNTLKKSAIGLGEKHRIPSTNGVHELLECPVCKSLMYPPIYQVFSFFRFPLIHSDKQTSMVLNWLFLYIKNTTFNLTC